ncbi:MAG TPA: hypothetical protein VLA89_05615 [Gemmatimonadales bacterium]|nr:hypothetical protein [Gemmatimonadales bacterium]
MPTAWVDYAQTTSATDDTTWPTWVITASSTTTTSVDTTWPIWASNATAGTVTGFDVWGSWCWQTTTNAVNLDPEAAWEAWVQSLPEAQREPARQERRAARAAEAEAARLEQVKWEEAREKAEVLLRSCLTPEQVAELEQHKRFLVSVASGRRYQIRRGQAGNVIEIDKAGKPIARFCIHGSEEPEGDTMLAQKLLLEHDEAAFLRIANKSAA